MTAPCPTSLTPAATRAISASSQSSAADDGTSFVIDDILNVSMPIQGFYADLADDFADLADIGMALSFYGGAAPETFDGSADTYDVVFCG